MQVSRPDLILGGAEPQKVDLLDLPPPKTTFLALFVAKSGPFWH